MIRVAIIEDHQVLVDAFELILHTHSEFSFVGSASTLASGRLLISRTEPDVLLLDVGLPDGDGLEIVQEIQQCRYNTQVVVLTRLTDEKTLMRAINYGINGFLPKTSPLDELLETIRQAAMGEIVMPSNLLMGLLKRMPSYKPIVEEDEGKLWEHLTLREREILSLLATGETGNSIADQLCIAPLTVRTHIRNIMSKLGVHSRLEAVAFGLRVGLIEHPAFVN